MAITLRTTSASKITKYDIPTIIKPLGTQPGDFMLMQITTLTNEESVPAITGWKYLYSLFLNNVSIFIFCKTASDNESKHYNIIRRKSGYNRVIIKAFYSTNNSLLTPNLESFTHFIDRYKKVNHNLEDYIIEYNGTENTEYLKSTLVRCGLANGSALITFLLYETNDEYIPLVEAPVINNINLIDDDKIYLDWTGTEEYNIEISQDNINWIKVNEAPVNSTSYTIDNLHASEYYYFRVQAIKANIPSLPSKPLSIKTPDRIRLRSVSSNLSSSMNPRILVSPSNIQKGDLMLMQVGYTSDIKITKISTGWKLLLEQKCNDYGTSIYYKIATRKEPSSYAVYHSGTRHSKILMAIGAFYSSTALPLKVTASAISYNEPSSEIPFLPLALASRYALGIGLCLRDLESSYKFWIDSTIMWDYDKNLRATGMFSTYQDFETLKLDSVFCNYGDSISAAIAIEEGERIEVAPPSTPSGIKAKKMEGTTIRILRG